MDDIDLKNLKDKVQGEIQEAETLHKLNKVFKEYLGKKGQVSLIFRRIKNLSTAEKISIRKDLNS